MINYLLITILSFWLSTIIASPSFAKYGPGDGDPTSSALAFFGKNKTIPEEMQEVILTALSFYPDLANTHIKFIYKEEIRKSVMQAQPKVSTLFRPKSKRIYIVKISRYLKLDKEKLDISTLPFRGASRMDRSRTRSHYGLQRPEWNGDDGLRSKVLDV